ncbi:MAG: InlB B-repeat-containing protein [Lachnospiraceae bacterium]|nr:InlB B-repeat-containing protein [Lachnospiraceae bacterium]
MERDLKRRKKQFSAYVLALVLIFTAIMPQLVMAADHDITDDYEVILGEYLNPGDNVVFYQNIFDARPAAVVYLDSDGTTLFTWSDDTVDNGDVTFTVKGYTDADFTVDGSLEEDMFKCWKVTSVYGSSGAMTLIKLTAVECEEYDISYELDGGVNATGNPDKYVEKTGVATLADASKEGYTFDGWYTSDTFAEGTKVTSIAATQTGDITLYAKFTASEYDITFALNGGTNGANNPDTYTYGEGVATLADASKEGYTFDGWYTSDTFVEGTKVTSIAATQTGDITLYAKFTLIPVEPDTGDHAMTNWFLALMLLSGATFLSFVVYNRRQRVSQRH